MNRAVPAQPIKPGHAGLENFGPRTKPGTARDGPRLARPTRPCQWEMKKWTGGSVILALAFLLLLRYALFPLSTTATTTATAIAALSPRRSHPPPPPPSPFSPKLLLPSPNSTRSPQLYPSSKLVCAHMRPLLLRFDALPGLAEAGKLEEVIEGGVEKVDLVKAGADLGGEVALRLRSGLLGPDGADLVLEPDHTWKVGGADVVGLLRQRAAFRALG